MSLISDIDLEFSPCLQKHGIDFLDGEKEVYFWVHLIMVFLSKILAIAFHFFKL